MIDLADLMVWLGNPSEPEAPQLLLSLEERAVEVLERETQRYFGPSVEHVEIATGDGSRTLYLRERPAAITSVESRVVGGDAWTEIEDGWELSTPPRLPAPSRLVRTAGQVWRRGHEYRVTYDFGYVAGEEPGDIRQAVMDIVALKYRERGREGLRSEALGDHTWTVMATNVGSRDLSAVPGLAETIARWRGVVLA